MAAGLRLFDGEGPALPAGAALLACPSRLSASACKHRVSELQILHQHGHAAKPVHAESWYSYLHL